MSFEVLYLHETFPRIWQASVRIDIPIIINAIFLHFVQISVSRPCYIHVFQWNRERFFFRHTQLNSRFIVMTSGWASSLRLASRLALLYALDWHCLVSLSRLAQDMRNPSWRLSNLVILRHVVLHEEHLTIRRGAPVDKEDRLDHPETREARSSSSLRSLCRATLLSNADTATTLHISPFCVMTRARNLEPLTSRGFTAWLTTTLLLKSSTPDLHIRFLAMHAQVECMTLILPNVCHKLVSIWWLISHIHSLTRECQVYQFVPHTSISRQFASGNSPIDSSSSFLNWWSSKQGLETLCSCSVFFVSQFAVSLNAFVSMSFRVVGPRNRLCVRLVPPR